jgi:5-formyltetrahydrofolate cyclo-ligase
VTARWAGRHHDKDVLREEVWGRLAELGAGVGEVHSRIPNFVGAERAAARLADLAVWQQASVVKCNPDRGQAPVRLQALRDGKKLYAPVPELVDDLPFVELDPVVLRAAGIPFEAVQYSEDFVRYGRPVRFDEIDPIDLVVVGCVAVTRAGGRTGKGGGFADLELGIFRELGTVNDATPTATTVHDLQVVADDRIVMIDHDYPLDWIVTPDEVIDTRTRYARPQGVHWDSVQQDQFAGIPFLATLRDELAERRRRS